MKENVEGAQIVSTSTEQTNPLVLISNALNSGMDIEKMERLFDLQERWEKKEAEKAFRRAMVLFQNEKPELIKIKGADYGPGKAKYNFNPLPKVQKAIDPILSKFGLTYRWEILPVENFIEVSCIISHVDGHSEKTTMRGPHDSSGSKNGLQAIGSTRTYLERYTLESAFGLSSDEDTDGKQPEPPKSDPEIERFQMMVDRCNSVDELQLLWETDVPMEKQSKLKFIFKSKRTSLESKTKQ